MKRINKNKKKLMTMILSIMYYKTMYNTLSPTQCQFHSILYFHRPNYTISPTTIIIIVVITFILYFFTYIYLSLNHDIELVGQHTYTILHL